MLLIFIILILLFTIILLIINFIQRKHKNESFESFESHQSFPLNKFTHFSYLSPYSSPYSFPCNHKKSLKSLIQNKYNDVSYDKDGKPNGGILVTMLSTNLFCPNYKVSSKNCIDINNCFDIFDVGDINLLLSKIINSGAGTNCYALDTTYLRKDLPNYLFGPSASMNINERQDFVIGLILDIDKIWNYIACMYSIDSGSIVRYNTSEPENDNWWSYPNNKKEWNDFLEKYQSKNLGLCGCGYITSTPSPNRGLNTNASNFIINDDVKAKYLNNKIQKVTKHDLLNRWSSDNNKNIPFSKYQWKYFVDSFKHVYNEANNYNFIDIQCRNNNAEDGYRENEIDIIVPNKSKGKKDKKEQSCDVIDDFKGVFIDSIMGIFTNAETNCTSKINKNDCFSCDTDCCCTSSLHEQLVKKLVMKFNDCNNKNIEGYKLKTLNVVDFNYNSDSPSHLDLIKIT